jgi:GntR family transcriptional regulator
VPTELELVDRYGVSRSTVREALRRLRDEGVLVSQRGRGTTVALPHHQQQGVLWSLYNAVEGGGHTQTSDVLKLQRVRNAEVARRLGLPAGTWLVHLARLRRLDGVPLAYDQAWLPADIAAPLLDADFTHTALYDELSQRCGVTADGGEESVSAYVADRGTRDLLRMKAGAAALLLERLSCSRGRYIEWRRTVVVGDRFTLHTRWSPVERRQLHIVGSVGRSIGAADSDVQHG